MPVPSKGRVPLPTTPKSPYQQYLDRWKGGCGACICPPRARQVVHVRGSLPCDVFFVGEAPGDSEDVLGRPFVGPAGHLLDLIIERAFRGIVLNAGAITDTDISDGEPITYAIGNLVGCIPRDPEKAGKAGQPSVEDIMQCAPRLQDLLELADPRMVVAVGSLAKDWLKPGFKNPVQIPKGVAFVEILHPAYILRQNHANQGFLRQQQWVKLRSAAQDLEAHCPPPPPAFRPVHNDDDIPF